MDDLNFAFLTTTRRWAVAWGRYLSDHGPGRVVDIVFERKSLFGASYQLLVADADSPLMSAALVDDLHRRDIGLVAVWDPAIPATKQLALDLGADTLIESDAGAVEFLRVALDLAPDWSGVVDEAVLADRPRPAEPRRPPVPTPSPPAGARIAVGGPVGAEPEQLTIELARAVGYRSERVALVDANDVCPSVAQLLNLPLLPNVRMAVDAVRDRLTSLEDSLLAVPAGRFWVLGGLADAVQWAELSPRAVVELIGELGRFCEHVIVQVGPLAENLADYGPDRFGLARAVLGDSDSIMAVGVATPLGLARLTAWLADVRLVAPKTPLHLALTRAPKDRFRRAEITDRLAALDVGAVSTTLLPVDERLERAAWNGELVGSGPFRRAVGELADVVVPRTAAPRRGRGRS